MDGWMGAARKSSFAGGENHLQGGKPRFPGLRHQKVLKLGLPHTPIHNSSPSLTGMVNETNLIVPPDPVPLPSPHVDARMSGSVGQ
eukprot:7155792-Ditylum_brightwellii.AAC.1